MNIRYCLYVTTNNIVTLIPSPGKSIVPTAIVDVKIVGDYLLFDFGTSTFDLPKAQWPRHAESLYKPTVVFNNIEHMLMFVNAIRVGSLL